jgi:hypothetical protein
MEALSTPVKTTLLSFGLFIVLFGIVLLVFFTRGTTAKPTDILATGPIQLNQSQLVLNTSSFNGDQTAADAFLKGPAGTLQFFVYFDTLQKTGAAVKCGSGPNQPDCGTGLYQKCPCSSPNTCLTSCNHDGYLALVNLYGAIRLEILPVPDASRPNAVAAQLAIQTAASSNSFVETIPLPPIPVQKWTMITVAREGRQFTVFYDRSLVSSSLTDDAVSQVSNGEILKVGDTGLSGAVAGVRMVARRLDVQQVSNDYTASTDTRGNPTMISLPSDAFGSAGLNTQTEDVSNAFCMNGSCLKFPSVSGPTVTLRTFGDLSQTYVGPGGQITEYGPVSPVYQVDSNYL